MELVAIQKKEPDGRNNPSVFLLFRDGDLQVTKTVRMSDEQWLVAKAGRKGEALYSVFRKAREAERDFAYMKYGDKYRDHCVDGMYWSSMMTEQERDMLGKAVDLLS